MKVKIIETPSYKKAAVTKAKAGDQVGLSLDTGIGYDQQAESLKEPSKDDVRTSYPEAPRDKANIEIEKGEYVITPDLSMIYKANGKKHYEGGTPAQVPDGAYIVSDFIKTDPEVLKALNLEAKTDKKQTWSKFMRSHVDPKYYNGLSTILKDDELGKEVDPFELKTAQIKLPELQKFVSKVALGNELTKAKKGKQYTIPGVSEPAVNSLQVPALQEDDQPMFKAKYGGFVPKAQFGGQKLKFKKNTFNFFGGYIPQQTNFGPFNSNPSEGAFSTPVFMDLNSGEMVNGAGENTDLFGNVQAQDGKDMPTYQGDRYPSRNPLTGELSNNWNRSRFKTMQEAANYLGYYNGDLSPVALQQWLMRTYPDAVDHAMEMYGTPNAGRFDDGLAGVRLDNALEWARSQNRRGSNPSRVLLRRPVSAPNLKGTPTPLSFGPAPQSQAGPVQRNSPVRDNGKSDEVNDGNHEITPNAFDLMALADAIGTPVHTYYPWAAKADVSYVNPQFDDPNYYPIQSVQRQRIDGLNQFANPAIARAVASYQPDQIQGIIAETQRARGNNLQAAASANAMNSQIFNTKSFQDAAIDTDLYNKTIMSREQRDIARKLKKQDVRAAGQNMINNMMNLAYLEAQNPQYRVTGPFWNKIKFNKGREDVFDGSPTASGSVSIDQAKSYLDRLGMNYTMDNLLDAVKILNGGTRTKEVYDGLNTVPTQRTYMTGYNR